LIFHIQSRIAEIPPGLAARVPAEQQPAVTLLLEQ
jgi:hypothetical protein